MATGVPELQALIEESFLRDPELASVESSVVFYRVSSPNKKIPKKETAIEIYSKYRSSKKTFRSKRTFFPNPDLAKALRRRYSPRSHKYWPTRTNRWRRTRCAGLLHPACLPGAETGAFFLPKNELNIPSASTIYHGHPKRI